MFFFFQAEDGIRDLVRSRGLGDVYKRQALGARLNPEPKEKTIALNEINLIICEGENIGIIGRNGAGKSTLLRTLTKVIIPSEGEVRRNEGLSLIHI